MNNNVPDLSGLKATKQQREAALQAFLTQQGYYCTCGTKVTTSGVMIIATSKTAVIGSQGIGMNLQLRTFCSRRCEHYMQMTSDSDLDLICERLVAATTWFAKEIEIT